MLGVTSVVFAVLSTLVAAVLHLISFGHHRKQALRFWERELKLPDATRFDNLKLRVEEAQAELDRYKDEVFDARQIIEDAEQQKRWMNETKEELANLESERNELARIQNELETTQTALAELSQAKVAQEAVINEEKEEIRQLVEERDKLRSEVGELNEMRREADQVESNLKRLKEEFSEVEAALESLKKRAAEKKDELKDELRRLQKERDLASSEFEKLSEKLESLTKKESDLRKEVSGLEAKSNALSNQIPILQNSLESLSEQINPGGDSQKAEESVIWHPVLNAPKSSFADPIQELDALGTLGKSLSGLNLRFHQRTVYAFHTALKTSDSSPLVVLAGVSGTGKSELPRRYSEAMGVNFLNLAVQPRWDSPQDLFGFYDYLEKKFRPTELTRALIQMDSFRNKGERGWRPPKDFSQNSRSDGMLMVLLDEMNLARVEYYFSEFLSRLETRRGIDVNDESQRKRAEISLEVAGRKSGDPPMQLFADKNVLFVGTMNEDETTQALSDKVIDRASVLRFGSPASISSVYDQSKKRVEEKLPDWHLPKDVWSSWQKKPEQLNLEDRNQLLEWVADLRAKLDVARRPIAYRVVQSMLSYAANYPDIDNKLNVVIADQIEQKILPRLRGLDPLDPNSKPVFDTIQKILEEADDGVLSEAVNKCCQDNYFQWIGLDRYDEKS